MTTEWIARLADDERKRDALRLREKEAATRKADLANRLGRRLIEELAAMVTHDLDVFRSEFPDDRAREVIFEGDEAEGGFVVRKPGYPAVSLSVVPRWDAASVSCRYCFASDNGLPPRHDRFDLAFVPYGDATRLRHDGSGQVFATLDALAEYLLTPVFTGRPR
jgi:hypothetical protein